MSGATTLDIMAAFPNNILFSEAEEFIVVTLHITATDQVRIMVARCRDFDLALDHYRAAAGQARSDLSLRAYSVDLREQIDGVNLELLSCEANIELFARPEFFRAALDESLRLLNPSSARHGYPLSSPN